MDRHDAAVWFIVIVTATIAAAILQKYIPLINPNTGIVNYPSKAGGCKFCGGGA